LDYAGQNAAHRGPTDLKPAGDFSFGDTSAVQFPDLSGMPARRDRSTQLFAVQPCLNQSGARAFAQDLPFELGVLQFSAIRA
jgi:hypothetical protein